MKIEFKNRYIKSLIFLVIISISFALIIFIIDKMENNSQMGNVDRQKKILYVDSYHAEYEWSAGITRGVRSILDARDDIVLKIVRMDTKRNISEAFKKDAALKVKALIESWKPDLVIASDDNASKYLISPYYKNSSLPIVFCGLNGDPSEYGFPTSNITGMLEVDLVSQLFATLRKYSKGKRIGYLSADTITERIAKNKFKKIFSLKFHKEKHVKTFSQWKKEYISLQSKVDIIFLANNAGIEDFNIEEAKSFILKNSKVPTGSTLSHMSPFVLISFSKMEEEFGEWSAISALQILNGTSPGDIKIVQNHKREIDLNFPLAKKLGIKFSKDIVNISRDIVKPGMYSRSEIAKKNYSRRVLNVLTHELPVMGEPTLLHARQFEKLTGIKIKIHHIPFGKLYQEALYGLKTGKYDIVFYGSQWIADFYKYLEPVPKKMLESNAFNDILLHYKNMAMWGDVTYQVNVDGDRHYFQYRKDLFENHQYQKKYFQKYGKRLQPPKTWKELNKLSAFFKGKRDSSGKIVYPIAEITKLNDMLFSQFIKRAASYAKHPNVKDGFYFDIKTMKPEINNPGFVEALRDFVKSREFYPPNGENYNLADVITSFGNGKTIFSDSWDDSFVQAMSNNSGIRDKVQTTVSLGSRKVWNRKTRRWSYFPNVNRVPYFAWGWTSGVSNLSKNKDASFDFLGFFANNKNHFADLLVGRYGVNPYRKSDLRLSFWIEKAGWNRDVAKSYIQTIKDMSNTRNRVLDLRIYKNRQYMHALAVGVHRALTDRESPQKALDEVARRWELITERVGRDKQRKAYSYIVKFENANLKEFLK